MGFDWPDARAPLAKVREELGEIERASWARDDTTPALAREIGDLLFAVVNLRATSASIPSASCAPPRTASATASITSSAGWPSAGTTPAQSTLDEMDTLWEEAKAPRRSSAAAAAGTGRHADDRHAPSRARRAVPPARARAPAEPA